MKQYVIMYNLTTSHETTIMARDKKEAVSKLVEVVGDPVVIESIRKLPKKNEA